MLSYDPSFSYQPLRLNKNTQDWKTITSTYRLVSKIWEEEEGREADLEQDGQPYDKNMWKSLAENGKVNISLTQSIVIYKMITLVVCIMELPVRSWHSLNKEFK